MANKTQFQTNNNELSELIEVLQGKVAGDGSGNMCVETSEVTIDSCYYVFYTTVEDGKLIAKVSTGTSTQSDHTITVCRNSSVLCGRINGYTTLSADGAELLGNYSSYYAAWKITGATASILMSSAYSGGSN